MPTHNRYLRSHKLTAEDRKSNLYLKTFMVTRMNAKTIGVKASYLSPISGPEIIIRLILDAAA